MTIPVSKDAFGTMLDHAGLTLSDGQKTELFSVYPLLQTMIARARPDMPREAEMSITFTAEVR
jgi:hypothetical protein